MRLQMVKIGSGLLVAAGVAAATIGEERIGRRGEITTVVRVGDVERVGNTVRARLDNLTADRLENPRVIVAESFRWANEMRPGPDDPSRAAVLSLGDVIPPHGSVVVSHTFPPRPERADGWFVPTVEVVRIDRYPTPDRIPVPTFRQAP